MTSISRVGAMSIGALLCSAWGRAAVAQTAGGAGDSITPAMVALGDSIFHGKAGRGTCFVCHGEDANGNPGIAPSLRDSKWLHGDGSFAFIEATITTGVSHPTHGPAGTPMPPKGGTPFSPAQVRAVAAYVYSLTHPVGKARD